MQFVLVHGGWQGGWCWGAVSAVLRSAGLSQLHSQPISPHTIATVQASPLCCNRIGGELLHLLSNTQPRTALEDIGF